MKMSKKKKLIPKIRFNEFEENGEWKYKYGDGLFDAISNRNHKSDLPILAITQEKGPIPREVIDYHVSVSAKSVESYKVVEIGDFIISLRSFQGGIEYSNYLGLCSPAYIILRQKDVLINDFYKHYFKSYQFIKDLNRNLEGLRDGKMISYKQFSEILIPYPSLKEQQKIAECLSSIDDTIRLEKEKLDQLKGHKSGLMRRIFPRTGKCKPEFRFYEFKKNIGWAEKRLDEVAEIITGSTPNTGESSYYGGEYMFVSPTDMGENRYVIQTKNSLTELGFSKTRQIKENSVMFVCIGSTIGKVAQNKNKCATNQQINSLIPAKNECISDFLYSTLEFSAIAISKLAGKQAVPIINKSQFSAVKLYFPTIREQEKIACCLCSLDDLITAQTEKIELLGLHKKGLMQGLFPKIN